MSSIHQFKVEGLTGSTIDFADFRGRKLMIVNVASECGYTPQYRQLQELYSEFHDKLVIIGFPSNDFGGQEPGTSADIQAFCERNYGVSFPIAAKVRIKKDPHPVYQWLQNRSENGHSDTRVQWNFHKYLLDEEGQLVESLPSAVSPLDDQVLDWLQN